MSILNNIKVMQRTGIYLYKLIKAGKINLSLMAKGHPYVICLISITAQYLRQNIQAANT